MLFLILPFPISLIIVHSTCPFLLPLLSVLVIPAFLSQHSVQLFVPNVTSSCLFQLPVPAGLAFFALPWHLKTANSSFRQYLPTVLSRCIFHFWFPAVCTFKLCSSAVYSFCALQLYFRWCFPATSLYRTCGKVLRWQVVRFFCLIWAALIGQGWERYSMAGDKGVA